MTNSVSCEVVNGNYVVNSIDDGRMLAESLFKEEDVVSWLAVEKTDNQVTFRGTTVDGRALPTAFFERISCTDSVLKLVLDDQYSAGGIFMEASDRVLELFVSESTSLDLRFINTTLAFFFIVPYYESNDQLITLRKQIVDTQ